MQMLNFKLPVKLPVKHIEMYLIAIVMLLAWFTLPEVLRHGDATMGYIDRSIWLLVLLSLISFLLSVGLCWWLLQRFWISAGLPGLNNMILGYKELKLWQQLGFYFACFAVLLFAAIGALVAVL